VGDGDGQAGLVGELLQFDLPQPDAGTVAAAAVGGDEQALVVRCGGPVDNVDNEERFPISAG